MTEDQDALRRRLGLCAALGNEQLIWRLKKAAAREREGLVEVVIHLMEFAGRRLHEAEGHPSLLVYCTRTLGYSRPAAFDRIRAAEAASREPEVLAALERAPFPAAGEEGYSTSR